MMHFGLNLYNSGVNTYLLNLINEASKTANISIKTPAGVTESKDIHDQVMQGETLSSILCTNSMDKISKDSKIEPLKYRNKISIPKLGFVDDLMDIHKCKEMTKKVNEYTNEEVSKRKLMLSKDKCMRMHVKSKNSKTQDCCDELLIDNWVSKKIESESGTYLKDIYNNKIQIKSVNQMDYLGDVVSVDGSHSLNIKARISKGQGILTDILQVLEGVYFGEYHYEAFVLMRNSLFLSVITNNLEISVLSDKDVKCLESLDHQLIQRSLHVNSKQSTIMMMLELGLNSVKEIFPRTNQIFT